MRGGARTDRGTPWPGGEILTQSYIFRLLTTLYPLHKPERPKTSISEAKRLNRALLLRAKQAIIDDGAKPLIVFFPAEGDLREGAEVPHGVRILKNMQVAHVGLTPCTKTSGRTDLFNAADFYGHYSPTGIGQESDRECQVKYVPICLPLNDNDQRFGRVPEIYAHGTCA